MTGVQTCALPIYREINRLLIRLSGVRNMKKIPDFLFIIDVSREETAVHEANLKGVPIIAMVDTNCDPRNIDYVIPSNDDAIRAIKLMVSKMADAVLEGKSMRKDDDLDDEMDSGEEKPVVVRRRMEEDAELTDETLLGASTLAKIDVDKVEEVSEDVAEENADDVVDEVDDVEEVEEEVIVKKPAAKAKKATKAKATKKAEVDAEDVEDDSSADSKDEE